MYNYYSGPITGVTLGSDPEVFVVDERGQVSSAIGTIGGSKDSPRPCRLGFLQEDNVLAEFNTRPAHTEYEWLESLSSVMMDLDEALELHKLKALVITSHTFSMSSLQSFGDKAMEFGCGAEWDAYTGKVKPRPDGASSGLRTAGGHIHIGYDDPFEEGNVSIAHMMDFAVGLPSLLLDSDSLRRGLYGAAGSIRHKPYGVEYRTLSNFWLSSQELQSWVYQRTMWATQNLHLLEDFKSQVSEKKLQKIINSSDVASARDLCNMLELEVA
jgi:hypothetical protein